ncbi:uncharacterized protein METZ01_LOCUS74977 [marine metagenome]|uniref:NIPSNAP domain-containing protein n=1 Tax=marine metagenome TaxID=408172 RepID=A0A381U6J0_9ZZZZ|tara:strand:- start:65 stop:685 length:621 start_codon:yes stop_codon:yes gene_type:complete
MIEVRSSYVVTMAAAEGDLVDVWRQGRESVWPEAGWNGRIQQMLHGHAQQSLFVWSSEWNSLSDWEAAMARARALPAHVEWSRAIDSRRLYGPKVEAFTVLEPSGPLDATPERLEVRSAYTVRTERRELARALMRRAGELAGWSGQNQEVLVGGNTGSNFVWSSTWAGLGDWEQAMAAGDDELEGWFADWVALVDQGGTREIYRNQ